MLLPSFWRLPPEVKRLSTVSGKPVAELCRTPVHDPLDARAGVNFQVTVLKILVSYPDGFASMEELKRDMAILATSGRDWTERTKRLGAGVPGLDIFSQELIERLSGGWRITSRGRYALQLMEARPFDPQPTSEEPQSEPRSAVLLPARVPAERIGAGLGADSVVVPPASGLPPRLLTLREASCGLT